MESLTPGSQAIHPVPPKVVFWFRIYSGCMTGVYALCVLAAPLIFFAGTRSSREDAFVLKIQAGVLLAVGLVFAVVFALPFVLPRRPWVWVYSLVLICIGMTSCCILPAAVPLLIYWLKPDAKSWFNSALTL
ncbi:MAG TPA: hypothetical protein P5205_12560 [Candidatus Paceibacterota bacterium]|nr:hypothetical protein [Verrucomicrobiota bacterium]HSA11192.1 hypothetical protein [Candidatus Paceibacterota bacterium]